MILEKDTSPIVKEDEEIVCGENCEDCPDVRDCLDAWED